MSTLASVLEPVGDLTHVFGSLDSWHLLRAVGRRPAVMAFVLPGVFAERSLHRSVSAWVVESEPLRDQLLAAGVPPHGIRLIYPGVDLGRFRPAAPPADSFRVVFASTPADPAEFEARGIPLLVETARRCPDVEFVLPWRQWGDADAATCALALLQPPPNFRVDPQDVVDMSEVYRSSHATICLFSPGFGKPCPNSVIEGLASGRPVVLSHACGISSLVGRHGAGLSVSSDSRAVAAAINRLRDDYDRFSERARLLAEMRFDLRLFLKTYRDLYAEVAEEHAPRRYHQLANKRHGGPNPVVTARTAAD
ncbi:MAG: glycosyltransferase [Gemmatimonadaceae bacterium]